jgi:hypothetical protein
MSKSKHSKRKLVVKTTLEMMSAQHRNGLLEVGLYGAHKNKVHQDKKAYNRNKEKQWHRERFI